MKNVIRKISVVVILIFIFAVMKPWVANARDDLKKISETIKAKKRIYIEEVMALTPQEKEKFWPLYDEFESGLSKLKAERIELAANFIRNHEHLSDAEAMDMLKQKLKLDSDELNFKKSYVNRFLQVVPGRKVVRFYQAENKFDTAATSELYGNIPLIR